VLKARRVQLHFGRLAKRIVDTDLLDESTVAGTPLVCGNDSVERGFLAASAGETKSYGHTRDPGLFSGKDSRRKLLVA
jgi:hypothetical protein